MKGKFYESEYEKALIDLLQAEGWQYTNGGNIHRQLREPLLIEDPKVNDLRVYLQNQYPDLADSDVTEVINYLRHVPGQSHFERLRHLSARSRRLPLYPSWRWCELRYSFY